MRLHPKEYYLKNAMIDLAYSVSMASACSRAHHGCVLATPDFQEIYYGYNGPAKGLPNECMRPEEVGNCGCVHAEQNAIAKSTPGDKIAFITMQPCERCAALLVTADVKKVYYGPSAHRDMPEGLILLEAAGVPYEAVGEL